MFQQLKNAIKSFNSDSSSGELSNNDVAPEIPIWISLFLMQTYYSGCLAVDAEQYDIAKLAVYCIFDVINCVRMEDKKSDFDDVKMQMPKHSIQTSIPLPLTLGELEAYSEKYLANPKTPLPLSKTTIFRELVL